MVFVLPGSVERQGEVVNFINLFVENSFLFQLVQKVYKSIKKRQSYNQKQSGTFLWFTVYPYTIIKSCSPSVLFSRSLGRTALGCMCEVLNCGWCLPLNHNFYYVPTASVISSHDCLQLYSVHFFINPLHNQWRQSVSNIVRVSPSLPSCHTSHFLLFTSISLPPFSPPLEVAPLIQLGGLVSVVSSQVGSGAMPQPTTILVHIEGEGTLLVAFKMHGFKQQKMAFPYILWRNFPRANYRFHSVVTLLWGSKP